MLKVMFDSNVYKQVCDPPQGDPLFVSYARIKFAIAAGEIVGFISETIFTIEGIKRNERRKTIGKRKGKLNVQETIVDSNTVKQDMVFGPERGHDFGENEQLRQHFIKAISAGLKVVSLPRIAGYVNEEVEPNLFKHAEGHLEAFLNKAFEAAEKIEERGAGMAQIRNLGLQYDPLVWQRGLAKMPAERKNKIAALAGEWADGDSVVTAIGLHCDYFCTKDEARGAGQKSVLSAVNKAWLLADYRFRTISPARLAELLSSL
jgi:hypothetical protein